MAQTIRGLVTQIARGLGEISQAQEGARCVVPLIGDT